jgi:hypothetical protein
MLECQQRMAILIGIDNDKRKVEKNFYINNERKLYERVQKAYIANEKNN